MLQLLEQRDATKLEVFFKSYGPAEAAAMCILLATAGPPQVGARGGGLELHAPMSLVALSARQDDSMPRRQRSNLPSLASLASGLGSGGSPGQGGAGQPAAVRRAAGGQWLERGAGAYGQGMSPLQSHTCSSQ